MALPDKRYIAFQGVQTYFVGKDDAQALSGGYVQFFSDVARTVPKDVYQQVQAPGPIYSFVNIGSTITLSSIGTFMSPNDSTDIQVYAFPYDADGNIELYYLKVYSADDILQFTREAQPANTEGLQDIGLFEGSGNAIENPQFVETFLPYSLTRVYSVSGSNTETFVAPDWSIISNGTGSITVTQLPITDITMPTSAPFALRISSSGITSSYILRQTISQSPRMFGNGSESVFLYGSLVAKSFGAAVQIRMDYVPSSGTTVNLVNDLTSADGNYNELNALGVQELIADNTNSPLTPGFVNIDITIPVSTDIALTSVQVAQVQEGSTSVNFIQESVPRQIDHLFHYYKPLLEEKPIPSALVGWDFALNPAQFTPTAGGVGTTSAIGANKSAYAWDQTILFSTVNSGLSYAKISGSSNLNLRVTAVSSTSWAIIQYIPTNRARDLLASSQCVSMQAGIPSGTLNGTVSLWYTKDANLPTVTAGTNNSLVSAITAGVPTCANGTWVEVTNRYGSQPFSLVAGDLTPDYRFSGWDQIAEAESQAATYMAIVVCFDTMTAADYVSLAYIGLFTGDIATKPAPQTQDQVLRECQYFWEKSYNVADVVGTVTSNNCRLVYQSSELFTTGAIANFYQQAFPLQFKQTKRTTGYGVKFYSPAGTADSILWSLNGLANNSQPVSGTSTQLVANYWSTSGVGNDCLSFVPLTAQLGAVLLTINATSVGGTTFVGTDAYMQFHYVIDARLGVAN